MVKVVDLFNFHLFVQCSMNATAKGQAFFGQGNGRIWMDNLRCTDNDTDLFTCPQNALGSHNCRHNEDAGVLCHSYFTGMLFHLHMQLCI